MSEYGMKVEDIKSLTREQMFLFKEKIEERHERELKMEAKLHGAKLQTPGLDIDGATPIELVMDNRSL